MARGDVGRSLSMAEPSRERTPLGEEAGANYWPVRARRDVSVEGSLRE